MANNNIFPTAIVRQLLEKDNYDDWSVQVETYLVAQDLWGVVEAPIPSEAKTEADKAWYKRNAAALHAIKISCSSDAFNVIRKIPWAKEAWDTLATNFFDSFCETESENLINNDPANLFRDIVLNPIVREFIDKDKYNEWSDQMKNYLIDKKMWDVVEADHSPDEAEAFKAWTKRNTAAFHAIRMSCSSNALSVIQIWIGSAKIAWATLATNFATTSRETSQSPANIYSEKYECFFNEVGKGNWTTAKEFLTLHPEAIRVTSPTCNRTALHVAVSFGHLDIVKELVNLMTPQDLEIKEKGLGHTAFHIAVEKGAISMAKCMVKKNQNLLCITDDADMIPISNVVNTGRKSTARYLYPLTVQQKVLFSHNDKNGAALIIRSIENGMFDIVFDLIKRYPHLIIAKEKSRLNLVTLISDHPALFPSGYQLKFLQRWIYNCTHVRHHVIDDVRLNIQNVEDSASNKWDTTIGLGWSGRLLQWMAPTNILQLLGINHINELKAVHTHSVELVNRMCKVIETLDENQIREVRMTNAIVQAASLGIVEFVKNISKAIPKAMWDANLARNIFESAIRSREAKVFSLIYGLDNKRTITNMPSSNSTDSLLHVAGYIANSTKLNNIAGGALQMQREMQWYKEVKRITPKGVRTHSNDNHKRASEVFTEDHKVLKIAGEDWMKKTSSSCTVVGALIFTIMFTATFTVPGGNKQDTGFPMFLDKKLFKVFIISDAISLFSSTTSVLTFLGILTSRYAEEDFLTSLPTKMILGLSSLFISIAAMMIAFCAVIALLFQSQLWIVVPTILLASIPVFLFVGLQFPLLVEIFISTYGTSIFDRNVGNWLA